MRSKAIIISILLLFARTSYSQKGSESDLKAAFIYNFILYTDWDTANIRSNFTIGILGNTSVVNPLSEIARSVLAKNKRIIIKRFSRLEDITYCNLLFISNNLPYSVPSILERVPKGTLTVSEDYGYARQGTALNFIVVNNRLKFEANLGAIVASGLRVSSKLLKLALIVD